MTRPRAWLASVLLSACCPGAPPPPPSQELEPVVEALRESGASLTALRPNDNWEATATLVLPDGRCHAIELGATNKGNAGFQLGELFLRTHDGHDDGVLYDPPDLHVSFLDLDGDGASDLLLEGLALDTETQLREPVLGEYLWDREAQRFEPRRVLGPRPPAW